MKREEIVEILKEHQCLRYHEKRNAYGVFDIHYNDVADAILALQEQPVRSADIQNELEFVNQWFYKLSCGQCSPGEVADKLHEYCNQSLKLPSDEELRQACPQTLINRISCWIQGAKWAINYITGQ